MPLGIFTARGQSTANGDTTMVAAPGSGQRIYVISMKFMISVVATGTGRLVVTNGSGGNALLRMATTGLDVEQVREYSASGASSTGGHNPGDSLSENTALIATQSSTTPATIDYEVVYEVKGSGYVS